MGEPELARVTDGDAATVESMDRDGARFRLENGSVTKLGQRDPQLRHIDRAFAATVHAFQRRTVDRILEATPTENPRLTKQSAFYVAISRAREAAVLVTDDAHKLADRLAALNATVKQAAYETVFGRDAGRERESDHLTRASDAMDRGHGIRRRRAGLHKRELHFVVESTASRAARAVPNASPNARRPPNRSRRRLELPRFGGRLRAVAR